MSFIEKSVARLDQLERLEALALELGKSHYHYNAPPKYYNVRPQSTLLTQRPFCFYIMGLERNLQMFTY